MGEEKKTGEIKKIKIKVVGIGGGGGNITSQIAEEIKNSKISFLVLDSDKKALNSISRKVEKVLIGERITKGFGTGMDTKLAYSLVKEERENLRKVIDKEDLIILISTLGGGTGSIVSRFFAEICKEIGILTFAIFTSPFSFEGKKKFLLAKETIFNIKNLVNCFSILPNDGIFKIISRESSAKEALSFLNKILAFNISNLLEIIFTPSLINIDFADLETILKTQGSLVYFHSANSEREELSTLLDKTLYYPIYPYTIYGAEGILFHIKGPRDLSLEEVSQISRAIYERVEKTAKIIFGVSTSGEKNKIGITILARGCKDLPKEFFGKLPKKRKKREKKGEIVKKALQDKTLERKNGIKIKEEIEKEEAQILEKEKQWETPPFLRKKPFLKIE